MGTEHPSSSSSRTSVTLLERLRDPVDQAAWSEFVTRYGPRIYGWFRKWGLQDADAQDVTQSLLLALHRKMKTFQYDPQRGSFRGWLKKVAENAWKDFLEDRKRAAVGSGESQVLYLLHNIPVADPESGLGAVFDLELLELAQARVREQTSARDWEVFRLLTLEERPGAEVAAQFNMKVAAVYMVKSRVQAKLKAEIRELEEPGT